jgi:dCTP deaminase
MSPLIDTEILSAIHKGEIVIDPFDAANIQPNSYDLTLGDEFLWFPHSESPIDPHTKATSRDHASLISKEFMIRPHEFVLATTLERVELPKDICAMLMGRSSFARLGLEVHQTAGWVDAGFKGNLTLELVNNNSRPLILRKGDKVGQLVFFRTEPCLVGYGMKGKYQDQKGVTPSRVHRDYR